MDILFQSLSLHSSRKCLTGVLHISSRVAGITGEIQGLVKKKQNKKPSDRPQLTQVKSSFSRCLSASFCGIKSWEAFWPTGAQAGVGEVVWSTGVQAEVGEGGLAHRDVG